MFRQFLVKPLKPATVFPGKMAKCSICSNKIAELFLGKLKGTIIRKPGSSKHYPVCFDCQRKFPRKEEMLKKI